MGTSKRTTGERTFEVVVSFDSLARGERFTQAANDLAWATPRVESGYLVDVTEEVADERGNAGQS